MSGVTDLGGTDTGHTVAMDLSQMVDWNEFRAPTAKQSRLLTQMFKGYSAEVIERRAIPLGFEPESEDVVQGLNPGDWAIRLVVPNGQRELERQVVLILAELESIEPFVQDGQTLNRTTWEIVAYRKFDQATHEDEARTIVRELHAKIIGELNAEAFGFSFDPEVAVEDALEGVDAL